MPIIVHQFQSPGGLILLENVVEDDVQLMDTVDTQEPMWSGCGLR